MKIILQKDIPNLGEAGDIVAVKNGYARNFLLPRNLVLPATISNEKQRIHQERMIKLKKEKREKLAHEMVENFSDLTCEFKVRTGEHGKLFGSVTALDIAENLGDQGFSIDKRKVQLSETIRKLGDYEIKVKLAQGIESKVKVRVTDLDGNLDIKEALPDEEEANAAEAPPETEAQAEEAVKEVEETKSELEDAVVAVEEKEKIQAEEKQES